ncbi:hypothetical protein evm_004819 [Chilo suppressalis]|nr:hypothetical protein evm_004819 [Chilo suppressalis]
MLSVFNCQLVRPRVTRGLFDSIWSRNSSQGRYLPLLSCRDSSLGLFKRATTCDPCGSSSGGKSSGAATYGPCGGKSSGAATYDPCGGSNGGKSSGNSKHQVSYKPYVAPCYKDHDAKNMEMNRPMSPHLMVYGPTLPAMTSILQRITGTTLTCYALLLSGGTLFLSNGIDTYVSMIQSLDLSRSTVFLLKILLGLPFCYHYFCGIRFCAWNAGKWLDMKTVYSSAWTSMTLAAGLSLLFALL